MKRINQTNYSGVLPYLLHHCQTLLYLNQLLPLTLSAPLQPHCYVANIRAQTLVIQVDSALWATRLRYEIPRCLKHWQTLFPAQQIEKIEIQVRPLTSTPNSSAPYPKPILSKKAATSLREVANTVTHPKLKGVLLRLATHADAKSGD
jgi:hypothetical protein